MIHKLVLFSFIYIIILIQVSPIIDHSFGELDKNKNNMAILIEVMFQIVAVSISWYYIHKFIKYLLHKVGIYMGEPADNLMDFISAIVLIGLQRNLIKKLEYITYSHPFRKL